jgi:hypothetical protein
MIDDWDNPPVVDPHPIEEAVLLVLEQYNVPQGLCDRICNLIRVAYAPPLTPEQAEAAYDAAEPSMSEGQIETMCRNVLRTVALAELVRAVESPLWLVWSNEHAAWWGANNRGYYLDIGSAGRYSLKAAQANCQSRSFDPKSNTNPPEMIQPSPELLDLWSKRVAKAKEALQ